MGISVEKLGRCGIDLEYTVHGAQNIELAKDKDVIALIGTKSALSGALVTEFVKSVAKLFPSSDLETVWNASLKSKSPGDNGSGSALTYAVDGQLRTLYQGVVPDPSKLSRHNACYAVSVVTSLTSAAAGSSKNGLVIYVANSNELYAAGCAAARAFPLYSRKTGSGCADAPRNLTLSLCALDGKDLTQIHGLVASTGESIREVACMGDWPCDIMSPQMFVVKAEQVRDELKTLGKEIGMKVFRMKELVDGEFGGIVGVGQGAAAAGADREAALIHLSYSFGDPDASNAKSWAMVGKGIVFDTGT